VTATKILACKHNSLVKATAQRTLYCSGHIGLSGFHHVVSDKRTQNLPIVLETPSFEKVEVWAKEVEVLNRLSGLSLDEAEEVVSEIRDVVKKASSGHRNT